MIVGLKRRRASKSFYDLGIVDYIIRKSEISTEYRKGKKRKIRNFHDNRALVMTFQPHKKGHGSWAHESTWAYTQEYLITKLCDEDKPGTCKNETCQYRFKCYTTKLAIDDEKIF